MSHGVACEEREIGLSKKVEVVECRMLGGLTCDGDRRRGEMNDSILMKTVDMCTLASGPGRGVSRPEP